MSKSNTLKSLLISTLTVILIFVNVIPMVNAQVIGTVTIIGTCGLLPASNLISYGTLTEGQISEQQQVSITNTGNQPTSVTVSGTPWTDAVITGTIMEVSATRYSTTSGTAYDSMTPLTEGGTTIITTLGPLITADTFWRLQANLVNPSFTGTPTQSLTFTSQC